MNNVVRLPGVSEQCAGWQWNGTTWVWLGPPPCPPPAPCPPPCPPPAGCCPPSPFAAVAKAQQCYDQSQALYNLVSQIVSDIFACNPGIIPQPPPTAGSGPIIGVTDGSDAAPGEVGEFISQATNGTVAVGTGLQSFSALTLTPGDWDCASMMDCTLEEPSTAFFQQLYYRILNGATPLGWGDFGGSWTTTPTNQGLAGGIFSTAPFRVSTSTPVLLSCQIAFYGFLGTPVDFTITTAARRRR